MLQPGLCLRREHDFDVPCAEHGGDRTLLLLAVDRILGGRLDVARLARLRFLGLAIASRLLRLALRSHAHECNHEIKTQEGRVLEGLRMLCARRFSRQMRFTGLPSSSSTAKHMCEFVKPGETHMRESSYPEQPFHMRLGLFWIWLGSVECVIWITRGMCGRRGPESIIKWEFPDRDFPTRSPKVL